MIDLVEHPDELAAAYTRAFATTDRPFLVDVRCDRNCPTPNVQEGPGPSDTSTTLRTRARDHDGKRETPSFAKMVRGAGHGPGPGLLEQEPARLSAKAPGIRGARSRRPRPPLLR
ncbi:hypothetical protein CcI49_19055 [Frankia sp. CcI49]|uniref:hypothetical protein n=1 Tax=Frankia sp. CcI49 TaxID=1745382 RepID=UPI000977790F|nr:hypothetical protein [Frankia sp. CcI49]ONH58836.1 hypothetical protein CcI49_19055 [Frankia sp. CcI49]